MKKLSVKALVIAAGVAGVMAPAAQAGEPPKVCEKVQEKFETANMEPGIHMPSAVCAVTG
jgi:succinate dehydrogenase/fumarate reductase flavoprotein subunit